MIETRLLAPDERIALVPLFTELYGHYGEVVPDEATLTRAIAAQPPGVEMLAAFAPSGPVGLACFSHIYPATSGTSQIYMKELYVSASGRGAGVGEILMRALARIALSRGCTRLDWTTARENLGAQAFYRRIGAHVVETKVFFRLEADALTRLADEPMR
ncbi:Putative acetyltransferase [Minicystis rosea]|nr:Putative acetyltransferase [Minicystis rosea]